MLNTFVDSDGNRSILRRLQGTCKKSSASKNQRSVLSFPLHIVNRKSDRQWSTFILQFFTQELFDGVKNRNFLLRE